jgi:hypothetical protein
VPLPPPSSSRREAPLRRIERRGYERDDVFASEATPFAICGEGGANLRRMVGGRIASGWSAAGRPLEIDSCIAYSADRGGVARRWPSHDVGMQSDASIGADLDPDAVRAGPDAASPPAPRGAPGRR